MRISVVKAVAQLVVVAVVAAGLGLLATALAGPREEAVTGPLTRGECKSLEGTVSEASDGQWACCFREIGQCWSPAEPDAKSQISTCSGDGCPSAAHIAKLYRRLSQNTRDQAN